MHFKNGRAKKVHEPINVAFVLVMVFGIIFLSYMLLKCSQPMDCEEVERVNGRTICTLVLGG